VITNNYDNKNYQALYQRKAAIHAKTFRPALHEALGPLRGLSILDIGCGDGLITADLARGGAHVLGIDIAAKWIVANQRKYHLPSLAFRHLPATGIGELPRHSFDRVLMNMVLVHIETEGEIRKIFRGVNRVLKPGGRFVFSDLHPALVMNHKLPDRRVTYAPGFSYFKKGSQFTAQVRLDRQTEITFSNFLWTPAFYSRLLAETGFAITRIYEPARAKSAPHAKQYKVPEFIVLACRKYSQ
jgi:ubiquinone/menaquinone biosynthesis C-methylase UbiE